MFPDPQPPPTPPAPVLIIILILIQIPRPLTTAPSPTAPTLGTPTRSSRLSSAPPIFLSQNFSVIPPCLVPFAILPFCDSLRLFAAKSFAFICFCHSSSEFAAILRPSHVICLISRFFGHFSAPIFLTNLLAAAALSASRTYTFFRASLWPFRSSAPSHFSVTKFFCHPSGPCPLRVSAFLRPNHSRLPARDLSEFAFATPARSSRLSSAPPIFLSHYPSFRSFFCPHLSDKSACRSCFVSQPDIHFFFRASLWPFRSSAFHADFSVTKFFCHPSGSCPLRLSAFLRLFAAKSFPFTCSRFIGVRDWPPINANTRERFRAVSLKLWPQ